MPTFLVLTVDTWQLIINTVTTIITYLLVALLQNTQTRTDEVVQQTPNAIARGVPDLMRDSRDENRLGRDRQELLDAVGLGIAKAPTKQGSMTRSSHVSTRFIPHHLSKIDNRLSGSSSAKAVLTKLSSMASGWFFAGARRGRWGQPIKQGDYLKFLCKLTLLSPTGPQDVNIRVLEVG